jgi:hypothetical protein
MGIAKDPYDIVADIWDRIIGARTRTKSSLAEYLQEMASLLKEVKSKFEKREVPSGEAKTLALLINDADKLASVFKKKSPELAKVFDDQLPRVAEQMCHADFFIDKKARYYLHESFDTDSPMFPTWAEARIAQACKELERAAGTLSGFAFRFAQQAKRSKALTK